MHFKSGHDPLSVDILTISKDCFMRFVKVQLQRIKRKFKCSGDTEGEDGDFVHNPRLTPLAEYARCVENCTTNILAGHSCSSSGDADTVRAVAAVNQIGFIRFTDEWAWSVCLWHKRFGGRMMSAELAIVRPGSRTTATDGFAKYNDRLLADRWQPISIPCTTCMYLTLVPDLLQQLLITHVAEICQTMLPSGSRSVAQSRRAVVRQVAIHAFQVWP